MVLRIVIVVASRVLSGPFFALNGQEPVPGTVKHRILSRLYYFGYATFVWVGRELGSAPHADHAQPCARAGDAAWMHAGMHAAVNREGPVQRQFQRHYPNGTAYPHMGRQWRFYGQYPHGHPSVAGNHSIPQSKT